MSEIQDEAYTELCQENEHLKFLLNMKPVELTPDETGYLLGLLKGHLEYHRLLAGNGKCTPQTRAKLAFLETLWTKLAK